MHMSKWGVKTELILASQSPRREEILKMLGFDFKVEVPDYEEVIPPDMEPKAVPEFLARGKVLALKNKNPNALILGSDTVVLLGNKILGKPKNSEHAYEMLLELNGNKHQVVTGVALAQDGRILDSGHSVTEVTFAAVSAQQLNAYAHSQEPMDKAGAYAIQGVGAFLVEQVNGCFYNVMGLPIQLTLRMLSSHLSEERND